MRLLAPHADTEVAAQRCDRCGSSFRAALTAWACPVCGLDVPRPDGTRAGTWLADPGNRIVLLVAGATLANAVLLVILTIAVSRAGS